MAPRPLIGPILPRLSELPRRADWGRCAGSAPQQEDPLMLSSYWVACPRPSCGWTGSLVPSHVRGGADAEIASTDRAWFQCPHCQCDWEVRISDDKVMVLATDEGGG